MVDRPRPLLSDLVRIKGAEQVVKLVAPVKLKGCGEANAEIVWPRVIRHHRMRIEYSSERTHAFQLTGFPKGLGDWQFPIIGSAGSQRSGPLQCHKTGPALPGQCRSTGRTEAECRVKGMPVGVVQ